MRFLGLDISRQKSVPALAQSMAPTDRGWWSLTKEPFAGAWQRNIQVSRETVLTHSAVYACITLIAADIAKLRPKLVEQDKDGIWSETTSAAFSPVLRKPNDYQNRIKFIEQWIISKLIHGNTYVLKQRDNRGLVTALYVLDPTRVKPLVAPDGAVYYKLGVDHLSGLTEPVDGAPASEVIHDLMVPLYHPLVGVSPIYACGLAAAQGLNIQNNSTKFFANGSRPGGMLLAPGKISDVTATRLKEAWDQNYTGDNVGRVAVLGDGLKYESMTMSATDAQLIEQLRWTGENVCSCYHVPPYMIGVGPAPTYNNIEALNQQYYTQCLQSLIEALELCLDEGLGLVDTPGRSYGVEMDLDGLLRMDTATQYKAIADGIRGGFLKPNEGRAKIDLKPVTGGDTCYMQHQDYSLAALAKRDAMADPFGVAPSVQGNPKPPLPAAPITPTAPALVEPVPTPSGKGLLHNAVMAKRYARMQHARHPGD